MAMLRRDVLRLAAGAATSGLLMRPSSSVLAQAANQRVLHIGLLGFQLGSHIPATAAIMELIGKMPGYAQPDVTKIEQVRTLTSNIVAGSADFGDGEITTVLSAAQSGADIKILGYFYRNTDQVFVVNSDKIKTYKDLENPANVLAVNGKGAIEFVMLVGPLLKNGVDPNKISTIEVGGSGSRMRALLSGRVAGVPIHIEQAEEVQKQGPFKVLFKPWNFYKQWVHEVWIARGSWLKQPQNARAAVDVLKATTLAFRRANRDFPWFLDMYRKYATLPDAKTETAERLKPNWDRLVLEIKAWPDNNLLTPSDFTELLPLYKAVGDISGNLKMEDIVDTSYAEQALKELGKQGL